MEKLNKAMKRSIQDIICELNEEIMETNYPEIQKELEFAPLSYKTDGYVEIVEFYGYQLWSSEDLGDRGYDEKTDTYEPMELYLPRRVNWFIEHISKIELNEE